MVFAIAIDRAGLEPEARRRDEEDQGWTDRRDKQPGANDR